jgi:O-antigen/teichoic acid export membrane protein
MSGLVRRLGVGMSMSLLGQIAYAAAQWLALAMLARWTPALAVGQYALALAVCGPVILFTNLQLSNLQSTESRDIFSFEHYFGLRFVLTLAALAAIIGAAVALRFDAATVRIVAILALGKCCEAISDVVYGSLMRRGRFADVSRALAVNAVLSLVCFGATAYLTRDVAWAVAGWSAGSLITLVVVNLRSAIALHTGAPWPSRAAVSFLMAGLSDRDTLRRLAALAWPMGVISTLLSLQANVPQYVIQHFLGAAAVGTFAVLAYPFLLGNIAVTAMGQAAAPQFADAIRREDAGAFRRVLLLTIMSGAVLGCAVVVATWIGGAYFLELFYSAAYTEYSALFTILACATAVRYAYLPVGVAITAQRRLGIQLWIRTATIVAVTLAVAGGVLWQGLAGAGIALLIVAIAEGVVWIAIAFGTIREHRRGTPAVAVTVP